MKSTVAVQMSVLNCRVSAADEGFRMLFVSWNIGILGHCWRNCLIWTTATEQQGNLRTRGPNCWRCIICSGVTVVWINFCRLFSEDGIDWLENVTFGVVSVASACKRRSHPSRIEQKYVKNFLEITPFKTHSLGNSGNLKRWWPRFNITLFSDCLKNPA